MQSIIAYLHHRPILNAGVVLAYALVVILPHDFVGRFLVSFIAHLPRAEMDRVVLGTGLALLGLTAIPFLLRLRHHPDLKPILAYLILTLGLVVLTYLMLFVLPTEIAHFPQYALMAILLFPFTWRFGETLFFATLIGAIDEGYQYFYLAPELTGYYDWNDVISDLLGAALGLIYLWTFLKTPLTQKPLAWRRSPAFIASGSLLGVGVLLSCSNLLHLTMPADPATSGILMEQIPIEAFWTVSDVPGTPRFHIVRTWEGLLILGGLFWLYRGLGRTAESQRRREGNEPMSGFAN